MKIVILVICPISIVSCTTVSPQQQANFEANLELDKGNYDAAIAKYTKALNEARKSGDDQYEAVALYGLGRGYGYSCEFGEAEN